MDFLAFKDWALLGLLSCAIYILWELKKTVVELNIKVAVWIERTGFHENRLDGHDQKFIKIEDILLQRGTHGK